MNWKKISLYILFSFAFSWTVALIMMLAHIKLGSITGMIFLAVLYMPGPALATLIVQKFIYKSPLKEPLRINFRPNRWFLVAWVLPGK